MNSIISELTRQQKRLYLLIKSNKVTYSSVARIYANDVVFRFNVTYAKHAKAGKKHCSFNKRGFKLDGDGRLRYYTTWKVGENKRRFEWLLIKDYERTDKFVEKMKVWYAYNLGRLIQLGLVKKNPPPIEYPSYDFPNSDYLKIPYSTNRRRRNPLAESMRQHIVDEFVKSLASGVVTNLVSRTRA